jgi:ADP-ribosyl-[dinitrogen reductase] hydrolase
MTQHDERIAAPDRTPAGSTGPAESSTAEPVLLLDAARGAGLSIASRDRAVGCLVGAAVGDALGAPFEFLPAGEYTRRFPAPVLGGTAEMIGGGTFGWAPGEFTDDTQMGMVIARSLLTCTRYDLDDIWERWRTWARTSSDVGTTTRVGLSAPDWRQARGRHRSIEGTAGNGALMRAFPLALATLSVDDALAREVVLHQAAATHPHPAAGWGAWLAVAAMRAAIRAEGADAARAAALQAIDTEIVVMTRVAPAQAERYVAMLDASWEPADAEVGNGSVWGCLAQAVWSLRRHRSYEEAVVAVIDLGGDADTVACVTGALAGAVHGVQGIPSRWATYVNGRVETPHGEERFDLTTLRSTAFALIGGEERPFVARERAVGPTRIDGGLHAANLLGAAAADPSFAIVSLCRTEGLFVEHPVRREVHLIDSTHGNGDGLAAAVTDAVDALDAFLAEGRDVVVHCHGGRSRTGLVLRAWRMRSAGVDEQEADRWVRERWSLHATYEARFTEFLRDEWSITAR